MEQSVNILEKVMKQVFELEVQKDYNTALNYIGFAIKEYPELEIDLSYECGLLHFRNEEYYLALKKLIDVYKKTGIEEVKQFIFDAYVDPNRDEYRKNYDYNRSLLKNYEFFICDELLPYDKINVDVIWQDSEYLIYYKNDVFYEYSIERQEYEVEDQIIFMINMILDEDIIKYESKCNVCFKEPPTQKIPMYLSYSEDLFKVFLCVSVNSLSQILSKKRVVVLVGEKSLEKFFLDPEVLYPKLWLSNILEIKIIRKMKELCFAYTTDKIEEIDRWYIQEYDNIKERVRTGKFKILFLTSRHTTALQYHSKNLYLAAKKAGLDCYFYIEKSDIHSITRNLHWKLIDEFRPDVIVLMDHFRFEMNILKEKSRLEAIVFLTWVQDPLPYIMSADSPGQLLKRDFILNHYISWDKFWNIGYDKNKIIDAPIPANQDIYKLYELTKEEIDKYQSDICFVCHCSDVENYIQDYISFLETKEQKLIIEDMLRTYDRQVKEEEQIYYSLEEFKQYILEFFQNKYDIELDSKQIVDGLAHDMYFGFNQRVYRQALVDWILNAGYKNLKLWGNGWCSEEKYKPYAMGPAQNGEELSKILQCSKIVMGDNIYSSAAARAWETMLSGGFYLCNYIPPEGDAIDIRKIIKEDEVVLFNGREDLLKKINFYLNHEDERQKMIKIGREVALKTMTFDVLMERIIYNLRIKM